LAGGAGTDYIAGTVILADERAMKKKVIVIVGAARAPGRGLIRAIVEDDGEFGARAVTRDLTGEEGRYLAARGAEVVAGQMGDEASLKAAFAGAYGAFYMMLPEENPFPQKKVAEAEAMARAAKEAGLQHVIWATLEDTTQAKQLAEDEVTPTFLADGRRVTNFDAKAETGKVFTDLGVPTTCLQATWHSAVATGKWAEEIGKCAYGIFRSRELIGKTVSISAGMLALELARGDAPAPPPPKRRRAPYIIGAAILLVAVVAAGAIHFSDGKKTDVPAAMATTGEAAPVRSKPPAAAPAQSLRTSPTPTPTLARAQPNHEPVEPMVMRIPSAGLAIKRNAHPKRVSLKKRGGSEPQRSVAEEGRPAAPAPEPPASPAAPPPAEPKPPPEPERATTRESPAVPVTSRSTERPRPEVPPAPGTVPAKAIAATVRAHAAEVQGCYERALMDGAELHGRLTMKAVLDPTGHVLSVSPSSTIEGGARLQSCVTAAFKSWTFPAPEGDVKGNITYSFSFE
jgi:NmrA-like family